jgi:hypothetical protein
MMVRTILIGATVFGVSAAAAGYVWTAFEFPFVIVVPAVLGWYAVVRYRLGPTRAPMAALAGGVTFTAALLVAMFLALTDGSPLPLGPAAAAVLAAAVAGAISGWVLARGRGSLVLAAASAIGMAAASAVTGVVRAFAPAATQSPGPAQYAYVALSVGLIGLIVGAAIGAGVDRLAATAEETGGGEAG